MTTFAPLTEEQKDAWSKVVIAKVDTPLTFNDQDFGVIAIDASDPFDPYKEEVMNFGQAVELLKAGKRVSRAGWNGRGMFVYHVPAASYPAQTGVAKEFFGEDAMVPYAAYLAIKNVNGTVSTWVPSVNDVLAEDWEVA